MNVKRWIALAGAVLFVIFALSACGNQPASQERLGRWEIQTGNAGATVAGAADTKVIGFDVRDVHGQAIQYANVYYTQPSADAQEQERLLLGVTSESGAIGWSEPQLGEMELEIDFGLEEAQRIRIPVEQSMLGKVVTIYTPDACAETQRRWMGKEAAFQIIDDSGVPLSGVKVTFAQLDGSNAQRGAFVTDDNGSFRWKNPRRQSMLIQITDQGQSYSWQVKADPNNMQTLLTTQGTEQ